MKNIFILIICCSSFLFTSMVCGNGMDLHDIVITNNSDETIYYNDGIYETLDTCLTSKDVLYEILEGHMCEQVAGEVQSGRIPIYDDNKHTWQMIVFKQSTLDKYTKEELAEKNIYDTIFVFTFTQLDDIKSQINIW